MYLPAQFKEDDVPVLHETIRRIRFATFVSRGSGGLIADHIPMLLDPAPAPFGTLRGHVARGNPHWREAVGSEESLVVFLGASAYISPSWYPTKAETGKVVPTWNYVAVHAYGRPRFIEDPAQLLEIVTGLTERHEGGRAAPWAVSDAPADFIAAMLKGIVGIELPITRLEGKRKMSQNRNAADRAGVVEGLRREGGATEAEIADIVAEISAAT